MGGRPSTTVDQRLRAIACLGDQNLAARVLSALHDADFEVIASDHLADVAEVVAGVACVAGGAPDHDVARTVLVFDRSAERWLGLVARLTEEHPSVLPFLLDDLDRPDAFLSALSAGVAGFCQPDASGEAIVRSIRSMLQDGVAIPRTFVAPLVQEVRRGRGHVVRSAAGDVVVTDREWDILQMLVQGRSTREMAASLYVSVGTVRSHVSALLKKLGAVDRDDAVDLLSRGRTNP